MGIRETIAMGIASVIHQKTINRAVENTTLDFTSNENGFIIHSKVKNRKPINTQIDFLFLTTAFLLINGFF